MRSNLDRSRPGYGLAAAFLGLVVVGLAIADPRVGHAEALVGPCLVPGPGLAAGFSVAGSLVCGGSADDWFCDAPARRVLRDDPFGEPDPQHVPALFLRDSTSNSPSWMDSNVFAATSNTNQDWIGDGENPWLWQGGVTPPVYDISEVYLHSRTDGVSGHVWLILGVARRSQAIAYIDFEYNVAGIQQAAEGYLIGQGPDHGRTTGRDFVVSIDSMGQGDEACVSLGRWIGTAFEQVAIPAGAAYGAVNAVTVPVPGDVIAPTTAYAVAREYAFHQFAEVALDLTSAMPDLALSDLCGPDATMMVRTRSARSFTAQLKDFALARFALGCPAPDGVGPGPGALEPGLMPGVPNPFRTRTTLRFVLPGPGRVRLAVFDLAGKEVAVLAAGEHAAGIHAAQWNGMAGDRRLPPGVYFVRLEAAGRAGHGPFVRTGRLLLLR